MVIEVIEFQKEKKAEKSGKKKKPRIEYNTYLAGIPEETSSNSDEENNKNDNKQDPECR